MKFLHISKILLRRGAKQIHSVIFNGCSNYMLTAYQEATLWTLSLCACIKVVHSEVLFCRCRVSPVLVWVPVVFPNLTDLWPLTVSFFFHHIIVLQTVPLSAAVLREPSLLRVWTHWAAAHVIGWKIVPNKMAGDLSCKGLLGVPTYSKTTKKTTIFVHFEDILSDSHRHTHFSFCSFHFLFGKTARAARYSGHALRRDGQIQERLSRGAFRLGTGDLFNPVSPFGLPLYLTSAPLSSHPFIPSSSPPHLLLSAPRGWALHCFHKHARRLTRDTTRGTASCSSGPKRSPHPIPGRWRNRGEKGRLMKTDLDGTAARSETEDLATLPRHLRYPSDDITAARDLSNCDGD